MRSGSLAAGDEHTAKVAASEARRLIERAILEGDAYALGFRGNLGSARLVATGLKSLAKGLLGDEAELLERLAHSFGGVSSDQFILARARDLPQRVRVSANLFTEAPRRGFDALVDALVPVLPRLPPARQQLEHAVARLLETSATDQLVRNLAARLLAVDAGADGDP